MSRYAPLFTGAAADTSAPAEPTRPVYRLLLVDDDAKMQQGLTTVEEIVRVLGPQTE